MLEQSLGLGGSEETYNASESLPLEVISLRQTQLPLPIGELVGQDR